MRITKIVLLFVCNIVALCAVAQIAIREDKIVEKPVLRPASFDSLTNIAMQKQAIDYKKYIGYQVFFLPKSTNYKPDDDKKRIINYLASTKPAIIVKEGKIPIEQLYKYKVLDVNNLKGRQLEIYKKEKEEYENIDKELTNVYMPQFYYARTDPTDGTIHGTIGTAPDSVEGRYFTVLDIQGIGISAKNKKEYAALKDIELSKNEDWQLQLKIVLQNASNGDTLYWYVRQARFIGDFPFVLVPFFAKQQKLFKDQNVRARQDINDLVDVNTGEVVTIRAGEVWRCTDVSFADSKESYYLTGFYFLKKDGKEVKIKLGETDKYGSSQMDKWFIHEYKYQQQELEKQKDAEQKEKELQAQEKAREQEAIRFRKECIRKWGEKMGGYAAEGRVVLGMNKDMCEAAWGTPHYVNRTIVKGLSVEQWVYGYGMYLYFDNGVLWAIQD